MKLFSDYEVDASRIKPEGWQDGKLIRRKEAGKSKQSTWLAKKNYRHNLNLEAGAILEVYAGALYQFFLPDNAPKTRFFYKSEGKLADLPVGSKMIAEFTETYQTDQSIMMNLSPDDIIRLTKEIIKTRIVCAMLADADFENNRHNSGFKAHKGSFVFKKIDHGDCFKLTDTGDSFYNAFSFANATSRVELALNFFDLHNNTYKWEVIEEIINADIQALQNLMQPFELMLNQYRIPNDKLNYHHVGHKENAIASLVLNRLLMLRNLNHLKKAAERKVEEAAQTPCEIEKYQELLKAIVESEAIDEDRIAKFSQALDSLGKHRRLHR